MNKVCTIVVLDEVNIKLKGLENDVKTRKKVVERLEFFLPYAFHVPSFKLGRWDGKKSYATIGGTTYLQLLDKILPIIEEAGYEIAIEDNRKPWNLNFPPVEEISNVLAQRVWPEGHPAAGQPVVLRDYQLEAVQKFVENVPSIQSISTGAGKCLDYTTLVEVEFSNNAFYYYFMQFYDYLQYEPDYIKTLEIGLLIEAIANFKDEVLNNNEEIYCNELELFIKTPSGRQPINAVIKKDNIPGIELTFENNHVLKCARKHILIKNNDNVYAEDLKIDDCIDTNRGLLKVKSINYLDEGIYYDINIPAPHIYYDAVGIKHHNTLLSAALSLICEPIGRTIVIVPSKTLVTQTEDDYKNLGLDVGVFYGDRKELNKTHTICTWQSLNALDKKTANKKYELMSDDDIHEFLDGVAMVLVDECHTAKADALVSLLTGPFKNVPIRWGFTGTIPKEEYDYLSLLLTIGPVVHTITANSLQEKGVLANLDITIMQTQETAKFADYQSEYDFLVSDMKRLEWLAGFIEDISETGNTLVLIDRISTGEKLLEMIDKDCMFIHGAVSNKKRRQNFNQMNNNDNEIILASFGTSSTGINVNRIFNLVLVEPGKSFVRVIQSIGRSIRMAEDKDFANVYDITAATKYSKKHLTERKKFYTDAKYPFRITKVDYNER